MRAIHASDRNAASAQIAAIPCYPRYNDLQIIPLPVQRRKCAGERIMQWRPKKSEPHPNPRPSQRRPPASVTPAPRPKTKAKADKQSQTKQRRPKLSRLHKPAGMSLEDWQIELRRQFGREQNYLLE